ncbi:MAG: mechanosensitive ion channel domain-containing protein [Bacteroidota bacterium]
MRLLLFQNASSGLSFDFAKNFQDLIADFVAVIPNVVGAIVVFIVGYLLAKIIGSAVRKALKVIGVDKLGDKLNAIDIVQDNNVEIIPSTIFSKFFYYVILLFVTVLATDVLKVQAVSDLMGDLVAYMPNVLVALILLGIGLLVADAIKGVVQSACESFNIPSAKLIGNVTFFLILIVVLVSALSQLGIETNFMIMVITIILGGIVLAFSLGYGLASRGTMANFLASRQNDDKFKIGDTISIDDTKGVIIDIDNSTVTLQTKNSRIIIPLYKFASEKIEVFDD